MRDEHIKPHAPTQDDVKEVLFVPFMEEHFAGLEMPQTGNFSNLPDVLGLEFLKPGDILQGRNNL